MTRANYPTVMAEIFKQEGGYVDHPSDPGGATNLGITFAVLQEWRGHPITKADVKALTKAEATLIYEARYWNVIKGDSLPAGVDLLTMDGAVNSGPSQGAKWLQRAVGVEADGKIGPATLAAVSKANAVDVINGIYDQRLAFLKKLKTWPTFGKGWQARVDRVRKEALEMAKAAKSGPAYVPPHPRPPDAPIIVHHDDPITPKRFNIWPWVLGAVIVAILFVVTQVRF